MPNSATSSLLPLSRNRPNVFSDHLEITGLEVAKVGANHEHVARVNTKRIYRLYREEGLEPRMKKRAKRAAQVRIRPAEAHYPNQRWSMDFVSDRLVDGRWFRILTVVDQYTRECLCAHADRSQTGEKVSEQLARVIALRGVPESITSDNGSEFAGQAMDYWAHQEGVKLDFIRPGKPVENSYIESFNGRLRDECLNVEIFVDLADAQAKIEKWRRELGW